MRKINVYLNRDFERYLLHTRKLAKNWILVGMDIAY